MASADTAPSGQGISNYVPDTARVLSVESFTDREKYLVLEMADGQPQTWQAGQFYEVSLFGIGEAPISICGAPVGAPRVEMCVRSAGSLTRALQGLEVGAPVGLRGPFGNGFDMSQAEGMDLLFVAGGLGLAPCRSFIQEALQHRDRYGRMTILAGFRSPNEILFRDDLAAWGQRDDVGLMTTVDRGDDTWSGNTGVITTLFPKIEIDARNTWVFIIGPPVMFKFAVLEVLVRRVPESRIVCSLERRMKCGLGKCGHCQIRDVYVCQDGPIFTYQQVKRLREAI